MPRQSSLPEPFLHDQPGGQHRRPAPPCSHQAAVHILCQPAQGQPKGWWGPEPRTGEGLGAPLCWPRKVSCPHSFIHSATAGLWAFRSESDTPSPCCPKETDCQQNLQWDMVNPLLGVAEEPRGTANPACRSGKTSWRRWPPRHEGVLVRRRRMAGQGERAKQKTQGMHRFRHTFSKNIHLFHTHL